MSQRVGDGSDDVQLKLSTVKVLHCSVGLLSKVLDSLLMEKGFYGFLALISDRTYTVTSASSSSGTPFLAQMFFSLLR